MTPRGRRKMRKTFWSEHLKEVDNLGDLDVEIIVLLKWILKAGTSVP